jgi:anoctamin-10
LVNIQAKNVEKGRFKVLMLKGFQNQYFESEETPGLAVPKDGNLIYYLLKVSHKLMNVIAEEEKMMIFNLREGIICRFIHSLSNQYESFHHRQIQEIIMRLMNDEFDVEQFVSDGIVVITRLLLF